MSVTPGASGPHRRRAAGGVRSAAPRLGRAALALVTLASVAAGCPGATPATTAPEVSKRPGRAEDLLIVDCLLPGQIRRLGSRNLLLASVAPPATGSASERTQNVLSYGLLRRDQRRIEETIPGLARVVPRRDVKGEAWFGPRKFTTALMGTEPAYADVANLRVEHGRFLSAADGEQFVAEYRRRLVAALGDRRPYFYPFRRLLFWGEKSRA